MNFTASTKMASRPYQNMVNFFAAILVEAVKYLCEAGVHIMIGNFSTVNRNKTLTIIFNSIDLVRNMSSYVSSSSL